MLVAGDGGGFERDRVGLVLEVSTIELWLFRLWVELKLEDDGSFFCFCRRFWEKDGWIRDTAAFGD